MAVCDASQWVDAATPNVPMISGRVVNMGFGVKHASLRKSHSVYCIFADACMHGLLCPRYDFTMQSPGLSHLPNRLKLRHYALLVELARARSVSRVAQQMSLSQPTVTRALAEIEGIFGQPLFARHRSGLEPTPAGVLVIEPRAPGAGRCRIAAA